MKFYEHTPVDVIRIQISKKLEERQYLTLYETTMDEVEAMIKEVVLKQHLSPFEIGVKTSITVREATGSKNGKSKSISFRGLSAKQTIDLIINHIKKIK